MVIVIPYREDRHTGEELKFALRSIEKYLTGYSEIIIVGDQPTGLNIPAIPCRDEPGQKETNIYRKVIKGMGEHKEAIMWHDDHYLLKPLHVSGIKYWHNGLLSEQLKKAHSGYKIVIKDTLEIARFALNFDIHTPIIFNRQKLVSLNMTKQLCLKSLYCYNSNVEPEFMEDLKINGTHTCIEIQERLKERLFWSTGHLFNPTMEVLKELYPQASVHEK